MDQIVSKGVGIDLGTTNSAVAVMNDTDTDIVIHRDEVAKSQTTPSCVWKNPDTGEIVVGRKASRRMGTEPAPIRSVKRLMGKRTRVLLTDEQWTPEQVSSAILTEMKRQIEHDVAAWDDASTSWIVDRAIVTVPAYFDQPNIDATRRAAELAGIEVLDLLHEPTAAACYHCWRTSTMDGTFLVYDLGGGTFDVSVVRCTAGAFEVLGISGNNQLGGDDIDVAVASHLQEQLVREGYALELDLKNDPEDRIRFNQLKFLAEGLKKALSVQTEFMMSDMGTVKDKNSAPVLVETMWERPDFEAIARPIIERTMLYCHQAVELAGKRAGITLGDVDQIILAGGSTHIPLVREMVTRELCAPTAGAPNLRAKCAEPVYEKVDTIVALGAAIRAAAVGGLATYNRERTVRVSFRGIGSTGDTTTRVGGKVEALGDGFDLASGQIRLTTAEYEDETDLKQGGTFAFTEVPLQPGAESMLTFEVFDGAGNIVATAGRPVTHSRELGERPVGRLGVSTARLAKALVLEVARGGKSYLKELIPSLEDLPASADFTFAHPGDTETVLFPIYQQQRKIQVITVPVPAATPRGTPIRFNVEVDQLSFITVKGSIGETEFDVPIEQPPDRAVPAPDDVRTLERGFREATQYLPAGERSVAEAKWGKAKESFDAARARGDDAQAVHELEEMEEIASAASHRDSVLEPPKEHFDQLVRECREVNDYVRKPAAEAGQPHDHQELARAIDIQGEQGEKAFKDADQQSYAEAIRMLEGIHSHLVGLYQKAEETTNPVSEAERAADHLQVAGADASRVLRMAEAQGRKDIQDDVEAIQRQLAELERDAHQNPRRVQEKTGQLRMKLAQLMNVMMGGGDSRGGGKLVEDHSSQDSR